MKKIRWGIISTGNIANQFASDIQFCENAEVIAVASRSAKKAGEFAKTYNLRKSYGTYEELYRDPEVDAIYVATPHNFHFENSRDAILQGKAVLCEKPITVSSTELQELIALATQKKVYLMEGMWSYFLPAIKKAQMWVKEGKIGNILHLKSEFGYAVPFDAQGRMYNPKLAGGALYDMGIYNIAMYWFFMGGIKPQKFYSTAHMAKTGVDDDVFTTFRLDEKFAHLHTSFRSKLHNSTFIYGDQGTIEIPRFWQARKAILNVGDEIIEEFNDERKGNGFEFEISEVSNDILTGKLQSDTVPFSTSMYFQEQMEEIRNSW